MRSEVSGAKPRSDSDDGISDGYTIAFLLGVTFCAVVQNVTLRTRAIKIPFEIPLRLTPCAFARSDRVFGNLLCKSAALPPQKLPLLAEGEFMLRPAKVRRGLFYSLLQRRRWRATARRMRRTPLVLYLSALLIHRFAVPLLRWRRLVGTGVLDGPSKFGGICVAN